MMLMSVLFNSNLVIHLSQHVSPRSLTYEVDSNYEVVIPKTINMNEQYSFTSRMMNLKNNESVVVFVDKSDEEITMTEKNLGRLLNCILMKERRINLID